MFKFLRKYNKWILAVGGALLMIVFLIPQAITSLSQRAAVGSAIWATIGEDEDEVSATTRRQCELELDLLERMGRAGLRLNITDQPAHWYLLVREAEAAGLVGGRASDQLSPEVMGTLVSLVGNSSALDSAITKSMAVGRMMDLYQRAGKLSDRRLRKRAERLFHAVDGRAIVIQAKADGAAVPGEAEILEQFETYREVAPREAATAGFGEETDETPGFGYRQPDRFKVEWIVVTRKSVETMIEDSGALDNVALFKHWQRNMESRGFPAVDAGAEIPAQVRSDLLRERADEAMESIRKFASDRFLSSWRRLSTADAYYVLSDDWAAQRTDFRALASDMQSEFDGLALPAYESIGDRWLTLDDIATLDPLDKASTDKLGAGQTNAATLIGALKEFGGSGTILTQGGIAGPPLRVTGTGDLVLYRVTDTDASRPPHDLDEVRDRVVKDLQRKANYERLRDRADAIERAAREKGLLSVAIAEGAEMERLSRVAIYNAAFLDFQLQNNMPLQSPPSSLPVIGAHRSTVEAIVERSLALDDSVPISERPAADRTFVLPVESEMALIVVELTGRTPLDRERFERMTFPLALQRMVLNEELSEESVGDVFSYERMAERHHFVLAERPVDDETTEETDPPAEGATANAGS